MDREVGEVGDLLELATAHNHHVRADTPFNWKGPNIFDRLQLSHRCGLAETRVFRRRRGAAHASRAPAMKAPGRIRTPGYLGTASHRRRPHPSICLARDADGCGWRPRAERFPCRRTAWVPAAATGRIRNLDILPFPAPHGPGLSVRPTCPSRHREKNGTVLISANRPTRSEAMIHLVV
jgi:hypothetical protein